MGHYLGSNPVKIIRRSRNLIPYPYTETTKTMNGITFTDNGDGSITVNGTATREAYIFLTSWYNLRLTAGKYTISGYKDNVIINASKNGVWWGQNGTLTAEEDSNVNISVYVASGKTVNNVTVYPMLNEGDTAEPYVPYNQLWRVRSGALIRNPKNLIPLPYSGKSSTSSGITYTYNPDGTITVNGTSTARSYSYVQLGIKLKAGEQYTISGCPSDGGWSTYSLYVGVSINGKWARNFCDLGRGCTFTAEENAEYCIIVYILNPDVVCDNLLFKPMLNEGDTAEPYFVQD